MSTELLETENISAPIASGEGTTTTAHTLRPAQRLYRTAKAIGDFFIALASLVVLSPLFLVVAIAIKIDSRGPVFFVQKRIGRGGRLFRCVKFRTMTTSANHNVAGYEYAEVNSYITRGGGFLRKYSIDELPQLYNMLTFKMSLIGYRPSQPCEHELNDAREAHNLYQIAPGITGWAQVNGRDILASHPKKKAEFDAHYLRHLSPALDVKIFFMTFACLLGHKDVAEGIVEDEIPEAEGAEVP